MAARFAMHEAYARLPMKRLVEPAVRAARQGFPLSTFQAYLFTVIAPILNASEGARASLRQVASCLRQAARFRNDGLAERSNGWPRTARGSLSTAMSARRSWPDRVERGGHLARKISRTTAWRGASRSFGGIGDATVAAQSAAVPQAVR